MIDVSRVYKVYNGKEGRCMCGCSGKYSYTRHGAENHNPGYDVSDIVSERSVKILAKQILDAPDVVIEDNIASIRRNGKIKVAYFE